MNELDFGGKSALVVGGSSGIGNGIARAFLERGAAVEVWGTRPDAASYDDEEGSELAGLTYRQVDVGDPGALTAVTAPTGLDVLVLSQGIVRYKRQEFEAEGWREVLAVNLDSVMACATHFRHALAARSGALIIVSSVSGIIAARGNPAYSASKEIGRAHV